jgi:serine/threonine protein kinase/WD40 repeat protein
MPIDSVATLVTQLDKSGLLEPPQLAEVSRQLQTRFQDPRDLARHLLERGWLTPLHVNALFQGRGKELVLGPYVLLERVGEGGMGQVFKARNQKLGKIVALKVIRKEWLSLPDAIRRFQREMHAASQLAHPNIVHAFDADRIGDTHLIAMEFVQGVDLTRLLKDKGPLPVPAACDFIRQAALGLQHAHERGLVHRDIKPSNLLLTRTGQKRQGPWGTIKILDMGLALVRRSDGDVSSNSCSGTITHAGSVVGTPDFIAPEQARDSHSADIRADLYSLGCTFYFLLTGDVPFPGGTGMEKLFKHQLDPPPPITQFRADLPPGLPEVVHCLLAKAPQDRYQTPIELARAVEPFITAVVAEPVLAERPTRATKQDATDPVLAQAPLALALPVQRPRRRRWLAVVIVILALAGTAFALAFLGKGSKPDVATVTRPDETTPPRPFLDQLETPGAAAERPPGLPPEVVAVLGDHRLRSWGFTQAVAWSSDGKRLAIASQRNVRIWDSTTGQQLAVLAVPTEHNMGLAFLPDGQTLVTSLSPDGLRAWDIASGKPRTQRVGPADLKVLAVGPDGRSAVYADKTTTEAKLHLWDLVENRERCVLGPAAANSLVSYAANGKCFAVWNRGVAPKAEIVLWDSTGKELSRQPLEKENLFHVAVAGDGSTVAFGAHQRMEVWNVVKHQKVFGQEGPSMLGRVIALAPDGQTVVAAGHQLSPQGITHWTRVWSTNTGKEKAQPSQAGGVTLAVFAPDGQTVLLGGFGPKLTLWDVAGNREKFSSAGHRGSPTNLSIAPDGRTIASSAFNLEPELKTWDVAAGQERSTIAEIPVATNTNQLMPDGQTVVTRSKQGLTARELATGRELGRLPFAGADMSIVFRSPTGKTVAMYRPTEGNVLVWEVPSFKQLATIAVAPAQTPFVFFSFSGDGQTLGTLDPKSKFRLWTVGTGKERTTGLPLLTGHRMPILNRDASLLASVDESGIKVWETASGQQRFAYPFAVNRGHFFMLEFAPAGDVLLAYNHLHTFVLDALSGKEKLTVRPSSDMFMHATLSGDGKLLAAAESDGRLMVWDIAAGKELRQVTLPGPAGRLAFAADNRHLVTANSNGTIYVLRLVAKP